MALFDTIRAGASGAVGGYEVERSLRFGEDDSRLRIGQASGNQQIFTFSVWLKRSTISSGTSTISSATFNVGGQFGFYFLSDDKLQVREYNGQSNSETIDIRTSRLFRDISSWFHLVVAIDTTQGTSTNRAKVYVNGEQETDFSTTSYPSQNQNFMVNSNYDNQRFHIGVENYAGTTNEFQGYIAEYNFIDGQQLAPSNFGETDSDTGQWVPINTSGLTFGTNGFYLNFSDNSGTSATTLGKDYSGNSNNFTPNNFATNDAVKDSPTNNFCTLNPLGRTNKTASEGNLETRANDGAWRSSSTTFHMSSGKWYWELHVTALGTYQMHGIVPAVRGNGTSNFNLDHYPGSYSDEWGYANDGKLHNNASGTSSWGASYTTGDILSFALDMDNGTLDIKKNNSATGSQITSISGEYRPAFTNWATSSITNVNFGQDSSFAGEKTAQGNTDGSGQGDFYYSPPSGYKALCSANLPDPTILLPNNYFDSLLWTGANTANSRNITGLEYQPDWVWIKARNRSSYGGGLNYHNMVWDAVRGVGSTSSSSGKDLAINETYAESSTSTYANFYGHVSAFNSNGFTVQKKSGEPAIYTDYGSTNYVSWNWNAGGSTVTNSTGTISAQVRASATAGFSIISYTGNATSGATVGHGLGVAPKFLIGKNRASAANWGIWHTGIPINYHLIFNGTQASSVYTGFFNNTLPSSTLVTLGNDLVTNGNGDSIILYAFSEVAGYSKIGTYEGNGSSDGTYVVCGFRPAWVLIKKSSGAGSWVLWDNKRNPHNMVDHDLNPNRYYIEDNYSNHDVDFLGNGFKLRSSDSTTNASGDTFIYLAIAEAPFKNARAR